MIRLVERHLEAAAQALEVLRWKRANHDARRLLRRAYRKYPWTVGLQGISPQQLANYVQTTLAVGITNSATTATLTSVAGLPTTGNFRLILTDLPPATTFEIVEVSSVNVGTGVVTFSGGAGVGRGLEGTTAIAHNAGTLVGNDLTAGMLLLAFAQGVVPGGYAQVIANQGTFTVQTDLTGLTVTVTFIAGRRYRITGWARFSSSVATDVVQLFLIDTSGPTTMDTNSKTMTAGGATRIEARVVVSPSAGTKTYKLAASRPAGTGNITLAADPTYPAHIMVEDIGQA